MFKTVATAGFALFSMFFGSGNLIFPFMLGRDALGSYPYVILGLIITAVLVPIMGFIGLLLSDGDYDKYFSYLGKKGTFFLTLLMLCLMAPFGIIPRCICFSYGGVNVAFPDLQLWQFSIVFCAALALLVWRPNKVVAIIGNILTPFKLGGIVFLIFVGLRCAPAMTPSTIAPIDNIITGITTGYQTMDLLASFFFAASIVEFIRQKEKDSKKIIKLSLYAGLLGSCLLTAVYSGFVTLSAAYGPQIKDFPAESLLAHISGFVLGDAAVYVVSFTITVSCLATATILTKLFVEFLQNKILNNKLTYHTCVAITLLISFLGSLLGFKTIVSWIFIMLSWLYPLLIVYSIYKLYEGLKASR
ncbi:MAG: branched-chain amino acid transport system II carrier protein [Proteobacteria bacterium]|nr:branched-chain amino acid transport system II carrier protein [Pseudomonadota bacterium]